MVRKQAGLPSPGFVTSSLKERTLQMLLRPLLTFQKCPRKAATASKARRPALEVRHVVLFKGTPENSGPQGHTCEPVLSLSAKNNQVK